MHQCNVGAFFERIAIDVAGPFPRRDQGNQYLLIAMDYQVAGSVRHSQSVGVHSSRSSLPTSSAVLVYLDSCIVTRAVTSSLVCYMKFCNAWESARRAPHPCARSQTAWWNTTLIRSSSTFGRSSHPTRETGTREYPSLSWLTGHPLITIQAWPQLA
jgi:hypothetical protein